MLLAASHFLKASQYTAEVCGSNSQGRRTGEDEPGEGSRKPISRGLAEPEEVVFTLRVGKPLAKGLSRKEHCLTCFQKSTSTRLFGMVCRSIACFHHVILIKGKK